MNNDLIVEIVKQILLLSETPYHLNKRKKTNRLKIRIECHYEANLFTKEEFESLMYFFEKLLTNTMNCDII